MDAQFFTGYNDIPMRMCGQRGRINGGFKRMKCQKDGMRRRREEALVET